MKANLLIWMYCILLTGGVGYNYFQSTDGRKIAYVKSADILNGFVVMEQAREEYKGKTSEWKAQIDTLTKELQFGIQEHEKGLAGMTKKEKQLSEELLRTKQQQLGQFQKSIQQRAQQEDQKLTQGVVKQINAFLDEYGKVHGYTIIFGATEVGNIVYAEDAIDITEPVLEALNEKYAK